MGHWPESAMGAALAVLMAVAVHSDDRPVATFAAGVEVVSLSLAVTDVQGRPITKLGAEDITLLEDGVPQEISLFAQEEWPIRLAVLLDSSGSMFQALPVAKRAATRLVRSLHAADEAQVARFNRGLELLQDSTSDKDALERAIKRIEPMGETALYNALYVTLKDLARSRRDDLARRAIVVLTDGEDTASMVSDDQLLDLARRAGVVVYTIGLLTPPDAGRPPASVPTYILTALARETGGRAFFPRTLWELDSAYDGIARELRTLYGVGYVPHNTRADGSWRRIAIQTREPNLVVRCRAGYYATGAAQRASSAPGSR
jgi:Ca-activated chloride channel homolog